MSLEGIYSRIDESLIGDISKAVIETPSPTGQEGDMARLLASLFRELGMDTALQPLYDDRANVVGRLSGPENGPTIMFSGHMDTSVRGDEDWLVGPGWKNDAIFDDGWVYGNGIFNMKGAFVAYIAMLDAWLRSGAPVRGELLFAGTVGEIELAPVDEFHGPEYDSYGVGTRFLLNHGVSADYQIIGEPTGLTPFTGMMGTVWVKITTYGEFVHTAFSGAHVDAINDLERLWSGMQDWRKGFESRYSVGDVPARVNRGAVRGGLPWRAARTAAECSMYLDLRFSPDQHPIDIQREVRSAVKEVAAKATCRNVSVEFYVSRPGTSLQSDHPLVDVVTESHRAVTGSSVASRFSPPVCTDAIDANRMGIPTLVYGPAGRSRSGEDGFTRDTRAAEGEAVALDDMKVAAAVYGAAAQSLLEKSVNEVVSSRTVMPGVHLG